MATPRKHWFRVADSVAFEPWDNDVAATFLRLSAYLNTRWARDGKHASEAGSVVLSSAVAQALTGSGSLARARSILDRLAASVSLTVDRQGANTLVNWPKYSIFQRYESEHGAERETVAPRDMPPPQDAPARRPRKTHEDTGAAAPASALGEDSAHASPAKTPRPQPPDWSLDLARLLHDLAADAPGGKRASPSALAESARQIERLSREATELIGTDPAPRIEAAIRWAFEPAQLESKFTPIVRCGKSLREKWTRLTLAAQRAQEDQRNPMQDMIDWMNGGAAQRKGAMQ